MILLFLPKENLYYFALQKLSNEKVTLNHTLLKENIDSLMLTELSLKYDNIPTASIDKLKIESNLLNTSLSIRNIIIDSSMKKFVPNSIRDITIKHTLLNPLNITIESSFKDGVCNGNIDLLKRTVLLNLEVSKNFNSKYKMISKYLKPSKDSTNKQKRYTYEYKF